MSAATTVAVVRNDGPTEVRRRTAPLIAQAVRADVAHLAGRTTVLGTGSAGRWAPR